MRPEDREACIRSWDERAAIYAGLSRADPSFRALAGRLVDELPAPFRGRVLDVGAGAGLLTEILLARHPGARVTLTEPAAAMRALAAERLGERATYLAAAAEELDAIDGTFDAVLSSAAMHLCDEASVFPGVAARLAPGGTFAFNLWWHSFDETRDEVVESAHGRDAIDRACEALGVEPGRWPQPRPARVRTRQGLRALAAANGLEPRDPIVDRDPVPARFLVDFAAMAPAALAHLAPNTRSKVLETARTSSTTEVTLPSVRCTFTTPT